MQTRNSLNQGCKTSSGGCKSCCSRKVALEDDANIVLAQRTREEVGVLGVLSQNFEFVEAGSLLDPEKS